MGWATFQMSVDEESIFSLLIEETEVVGGEEVGKTIGRFAVFVQVVVSGPDGVVEVEVSEEDGVGKEGLDRCHCFDGRVV